MHPILIYYADHFSECVENHAFETYDKFIKAQGGEFVTLRFKFWLLRTCDDCFLLFPLCLYLIIHLCYLMISKFVMMTPWTTLFTHLLPSFIHKTMSFYIFEADVILILLMFYIDELKKLPAPDVAVKYYTGGDLYLFGKLVDSISLELAKKLIVYW